MTRLCVLESMAEDPTYFEQDTETGRISKKYSDEQFVSAVQKHSPASTSEVSSAVGCSSDNAYRRLKRLESDKKVRSKMAGNSLIWFPNNNNVQF